MPPTLFSKMEKTYYESFNPVQKPVMPPTCLTPPKRPRRSVLTPFKNRSCLQLWDPEREDAYYWVLTPFKNRSCLQPVWVKMSYPTSCFNPVQKPVMPPTPNERCFYGYNRDEVLTPFKNRSCLQLCGATTATAFRAF